MTEHRWFRQSHVTAVALLLATAFKACVIAAVGIAFAQHLWQILRQRPHTIRSIEQFFHLRSNPFALGRLKGIPQAPVLMLMALFVWLIPLAVVYPPSTLTISFQAFA